MAFSDEQEDKIEVASPELVVDPLDDDIIAKNLGDKYEVVELLGRGGMGAVYKVKHKALDKTFAIKILNPELMKNRASVKRFKQEASAASQLTHANLAAVYDYGEGDAGAPFIVMDYLDGQSLDKVLSHEAYLDQTRALDLFLQATEAVAHAHLKGLIHRDIKPANLIITTQGDIEHVKLVDFGIAKVVSEDNKPTQNLTQTGEIFGSPMYMSPEQCQGLSLDARSDIYSMGCVMYETLTGSPPFRGDNPIQTILQHVSDSPEPLSKRRRELNISPDFEALVMHCLEKDPADRYQSMNELRMDLLAVRSGRKIKCKKSTLRALHNKIPPGRAVGSTLLVGCLLLAGVLYWQQSFLFKQGAGGNSPLTAALTGDALHDAQELDKRSYEYFVRGDYAKAIPLLEFGIQTYREGRGGFEDNYLADNYSHVGKCYLNLKNWPKAAENYREALRIYKKYGRSAAPMMSEAVADYATVLKATGRDADAQSLQADFAKNNNVGQIP